MFKINFNLFNFIIISKLQPFTIRVPSYNLFSDGSRISETVCQGVWRRKSPAGFEVEPWQWQGTCGQILQIQ